MMWQELMLIKVAIAAQDASKSASLRSRALSDSRERMKKHERWVVRWEGERDYCWSRECW